MKKLLTLAALMGVASASYAQGYVAFANSSATRISNNGALQPAAPVGTYLYELIDAPQGTASVNLSSWTPVAVGPNTASAGRMNGNNYDSSAAVQISNFAGGTTANFAIVGWSSNIGADYAAALAFWNNGDPTHTQSVANGTTGFFGVSPVSADIAVANTGGPYNSVWTTGMNLTSYTVSVPEPGTLALAGLGAAAMMIFRRRK